MTAAQTIRLYDFFKEHLKVADESKVKVFVEEREKIVEGKFDAEKANFLQKAEYEKIEHKIDLLRQEYKTGNAEVKAEVKSEINKLMLWIFTTMIAIAGLALAFSKFFIK